MALGLLVVQIHMGICVLQLTFDKYLFFLFCSTEHCFLVRKSFERNRSIPTLCGQQQKQIAVSVVGAIRTRLPAGQLESEWTRKAILSMPLFTEAVKFIPSLSQEEITRAHSLFTVIIF